MLGSKEHHWKNALISKQIIVNVFLSIPRSHVKMGEHSCTNSHPPYQKVLNG